MYHKPEEISSIVPSIFQSKNGIQFSSCSLLFFFFFAYNILEAFFLFLLPITKLKPIWNRMLSSKLLKQNFRIAIRNIFLLFYRSYLAQCFGSLTVSFATGALASM